MQGAPLPPAPELERHHVHDVAVVGGGFSGVMTAVHLLRGCPEVTSILLIERSGTVGRGLAFGTATAGHLLNVPARNMSALPDEPAHFHAWLQHHKDPDITPGAFVSRQWYGEYIASILAEQRRKPGAASLHSVSGEVTAIDQWDSFVGLTLADGSHLRARFVVLAVGNFPPPDPLPLRKLSSRRYAKYAWSEDALEGIGDGDSILLIGSGLTAIDQIVTLTARGFKGTIYMLSRRGLLPAKHSHEPVWPTQWTRQLPASVRALVNAVREQVRMAAAQNIDWRPVIDSMRPATQRLWMSLSVAEKRRFLRHVRSFWEVHRHRIAPEVGRLVDELQQQGRLILKTGRVLTCLDCEEHMEVAYRDRETASDRTIRVARIVNCTGHETDARKIDSPVLKSLLEGGLARVDASLLGLEVDEDGALIDSTGSASKVLFALGSARKGLLWESTAVPEIRGQAQALAERLTAELAQESNALRSAV